MPMVIFSTLVIACGFLAYGFVVGYASPAESRIIGNLGLSIAQMRELDANLSPQLKNILQKNESAESVEKRDEENAIAKSCSVIEVHQSSVIPIEIPEKFEVFNDANADVSGFKRSPYSHLSCAHIVTMLQALQIIHSRSSEEHKLCGEL